MVASASHQVALQEPAPGRKVAGLVVAELAASKPVCTIGVAPVCTTGGAM